MPLIQKGFTLIEILVAISIIIVVFGVIISSANAVNIRARDSQRQADLRNIQSALQQYYADQNFYPNNATGTTNAFTLPNSTTAVPLTNKSGNPSVTGSPSKTYSSSLPQDPISGTPTPYCYKAFISSSNLSSCDNASSSTTTCQYYQILAKLENPPTGGSTYTAPSGNNCSTTTNIYNLQVTPL